MMIKHINFEILKKTKACLFLLIYIAGYGQVVLPSGVSGTENFVFTRSYLDATTTSNTSTKQSQTISYQDGLGKPKQTIAIGAAPNGKDWVTPIVYDKFGRQSLDILPIPLTTTSGGLQAKANNSPYDQTDADAYYGERSYAEKEFEKTPLDRVLKQGHPGNDWAVVSGSVTDRVQRLSYETNETNEVKRYVANFVWTNNTIVHTLSFPNNPDTDSGYYKQGQLYKTKVTDEDGNISYEYKNGKGLTILTRKINIKSDGTPENIDTYYVYNVLNQLAYIIPPLAVGNVIGLGAPVCQSCLNQLCYQYNYDNRGLLLEKKLPGKGWEYMVYDNQDRLVMTQDANLGANNQWLFTKYDQFGRVAYTGIYTSSQNYERAGRIYEQGQVNGKGSNNVARTSSGFAQPGVLVYYDNLTANNYPNTIAKLLSINYYDTYPTDKPNLSTLNFAQSFISDTATSSINTKGFPTAFYINNVETNGWTKSYSYYDGKGRAIATYSKNYLGGYTKTESFLDFTGVTQQVITKHKRKNADVELVVREEFGYDHQNRLLTHTHEVVGKTPKELMVENHYNEIGQLDWKKVGGVSGNYLQKVDLSYNIRGWMTGINSGDIAYNATDESYVLNNGKLFGYNIRYNNPENPSLGAAKYNGNIAEVDWISRNVSLKRYGYQYDRLNRLLKGNYQDPGTTLPETHINDETLTYDLNGNIKTLVRNAKHAKNNTPVVIDNLDYNQYEGNKILRINDLSNNGSGYEGGGGLMEYDANGNMTKMPDKGISSIIYNHLNLPRQIDQNANVTNYYYRADGVKVKKKFTLTNTSGTKIINTEYLDGFQYSTPNTEPIRKAIEEPDDITMEVASAGEIEAFVPDLDRKVVAVIDPGTPEVDNMILSFFPTAEGYYDYENFRYIYQYKDHLGNVRVSYVKNPDNTLKVMDTNEYYPFGMSFLKGRQQSIYDPMAIPYNYKFGNKELQEFGGYDFGARIYSPDAPHWWQIDPLAEKFSHSSPYGYVLGNPIKNVDPDGRDVIIWYKASNGKMQTYDYKYGAGYTGKNKYLIAFHKAANALIKSGAGGNLKALDSRKEKVWVSDIKYNDKEGANFNPNTDIISWNPTKGLRTTNDKELTPTAVLDHEFDHANNYYQDPDKNTLNTLKPTGDNYDNVEEMRVIQGSEQSTAKKLGLIKDKEVTRTDHRGTIYDTAGVNTTQTPATEIQEVVITAKKKK